MKAIIVGGGVGGLTTALMLHARGIDCAVYEQTDGIRELGVGINTLPHAIKELKELGLLERLDAVAIRTYELFYMNRFGQEIWREPRGLDAGYDVPQFSIHRGKLQGVIYQAARARLGESRFHLGHRLGTFTQDDAGVTCVFLRPRRLAYRDHARRRADRRRRHPFVRARKTVSERRPGALERDHAVARRGRLAQFWTGRSMAIAGGMEREVGALSDRRRQRARSPPHQLGGDGEGLAGGRAAAAPRKTGRAPGR